MKKTVVLSVFGTRPEAIKMAPLVLELAQRKEIRSIVAVTAQHREMLDQVLDLFDISPEHDLNLMQQRQGLPELTGRVLSQLTPVLEKEKPDLVLVHGDTTTTMAASLAAFYLKIPVGHVEAGLRTPERYNPFPEEMNRRLTSQIAELHFAPTQTARENLLRNGLEKERIFVTGNTVIDALFKTAEKLPPPPQEKILLLTAHRRENWGEPMQNICRAALRLVERNQDLKILFPVHLNPVVRETVFGILGKHPRIQLIDPLDYAPFVQAMRSSHLILTDSGGVQEEGPSFGKPVLVLRTTTERPEAIDAGTVQLVGIEEEDIFSSAQRLLDDPKAYEKMARAMNPYGDGKACPRIVHAILEFLGMPQPALDMFSP
ncbi:MAG TPA: UDP-N-acetylglucosamine 2-epimerase (non-hydrolyzing) [Cyanobacteria bacterium UBA8530]|nr:UDP-N-acetylglucosamine 2-epimerase (non-hydrolyzing) [Cyanobacteria bacterium UBA8530]